MFKVNTIRVKYVVTTFYRRKRGKVENPVIGKQNNKMQEQLAGQGQTATARRQTYAGRDITHRETKGLKLGVKRVGANIVDLSLCVLKAPC
jgi:hypothetical protein